MRLISLFFVLLLLSAPVFAQPVQVTEDYLLLQIHRNFARRMGPVWDNMWGWCGGSTIIDSSQWPDHKIIDVEQNNHHMKVGFTALGYDPQLSSFEYGKPSDNVAEKTLIGHDYIYDLRNSSFAGDFSQTDEVTLARDRSVQVTHGITMNASVSSETKISGAYAGIGLEETINASFGIEKSTEEQKAQSESKSVTESHTFNVKLPKGKITRIYLTTGATHQSREVSMRAVADWTVEFYLGQPCTFSASWWYGAGQYILNKNNPQITACWNIDFPWQDQANAGWGRQFETPCKVTIPLDELEAALTGKHADWQGLVGLWEKLYSTTRSSAMAALDSVNREVNVSGVETLIFDHEIVEKVEQITSDDVDTLVDGGAKLCAASDSNC